MADFDSLGQSIRAGNVLSQIANPQIVNPLAAFSSGIGVARQVMGLREQQAQQALGEAYQGAIDPATGRYDPLKFNALVAADPRTALAAKAGVESSTTLAGQNQDQGIKSNAAIGNAISAALTAPDDKIHSAVADGIQRLMDTGAIPRDQGLLIATKLSNDPTQLRAQLQRIRISMLPPALQTEEITGKPYTQSEGGSIGSGTQAPAWQGGGQRPATSIQTTMTPGEAGSKVEWTDPDGVVHQTTGAEYATARGLGRVVGPARMLPASGGGGGTGGGGAAGTPNAPNAPSPSNPPKLSDTTGPVPGSAEKWKASADQYTRDTEAAGNFQARIFPLVQSHALLESGDVTTGRGAETVQHIKGLLGTVAGQFGWDLGTINQAKFEELNKYLTQYTNSLPMAGASDARLASAITGNPSAHISTLANKDVVKALIGLERMKQTAISDFAARGGQPKDYADYLRTWQNTHDPRAFIFDMLDETQRKKMVAGMTGPERKAFFDTLELVERNPGVMGQAALPH